MNIVNFKEMINYGFDKEYEYKSHKWINQQLNCSCIVAICTDIEPKKEEIDFTSRLFTKQNTLQQLITESIKSDDVEIKKKFDEFKTELENARLQLKLFIDKKKNEYNLPVGSDFNSEYYYIKIKKGADCSY